MDRRDSEAKISPQWRLSFWPQAAEAKKEGKKV